LNVSIDFFVETALKNPALMNKILSSFITDLKALDQRVIFTFIYTSAGLSAIYYLKEPSAASKILNPLGLESLSILISDSTRTNFYQLCWWVIIVTLFYLVIPALVIKFYWKENLTDYGLKLSGQEKILPILAPVSLFLLPAITFLSATSAFASKYPFLQLKSEMPSFSTLLIFWEILYFLQFFGLEFFFRGFLVQSLKPVFGMYSVLIMTVPYCMIHFGKPPLETFSAIIAGLFLGWLSFRSGSIFIGLLLHCLIAFAMDLTALYHKGLFS
jgi:membrane protease YdiL (CAAX protease family)